MKIICIGRNYAEHIKELNNSANEEPVIFMKGDNALITGRNPFFIPDWSNDIHYECELVLRINRLGKNISAKFAHKYFSEISIGIDFTARDLQSKLKAKGLPWELSKSFDGAAAIGKFIPVDSFKDFQNISFHLNLNGETVQNGNSKMMLFTIRRIIEYVSSYMTLKKGDLIFTGTPAGVGKVSKNDVLEAYIENEKLLNLKIK
ncbi:MAG TPA: fumarylacetoacetate hydrolase family protein [Bacteroidia bacterium]|nr:fumarylacetoacetate hydrolase family protein [Bacteroidia bacterium]HNT80390.1 fumarylacetoacetate hydrolase family protein [Bacteroidia bacterium]